MPNNSFDTLLYIVAGIAIVLILVGIVVALIGYFKVFSRELEYLNNEIKRTNGNERKRWCRRRRRLWLSLLPFVKYR